MLRPRRELGSLCQRRLIQRRRGHKKLHDIKGRSVRGARVQVGFRTFLLAPITDEYRSSDSVVQCSVQTVTTTMFFERWTCSRSSKLIRHTSYGIHHTRCRRSGRQPTTYWSRCSFSPLIILPMQYNYRESTRALRFCRTRERGREIVLEANVASVEFEQNGHADQVKLLEYATNRLHLNLTKTA